MADKNLILKKSLQKIVKNAIKKDPVLSEVYRVDVTFLFRSPVMSAMCDWVYGLKIYTKTEYVDRIAISNKLKSRLQIFFLKYPTTHSVVRMCPLSNFPF